MEVGLRGVGGGGVCVRPGERQRKTKSEGERERRILEVETGEWVETGEAHHWC